VVLRVKIFYGEELTFLVQGKAPADGAMKIKGHSRHKEVSYLDENENSWHFIHTITSEDKC
jgi:hypothetical protein